MRIAIVGSGISGLSALWILKTYSDHEVNIYEQNDYAGGHAHTVEYQCDKKEPCSVDTGAMAFNRAASPNLARFFQLLNIPLQQTKITLSVSNDGTPSGISSLANLFSPRAWRTSFDALRFAAYAPDIVGAEDADLTMAQYLEREGYSRSFIDEHLLPLIAFLWLTPDDATALDMPAPMVVKGLLSNGLLDASKADWMTVQGGTKTFVDAVTSIVPPENLHLNTKIVGVSSHEHGVTLIEESGAHHGYDHVILAVHSDTALEMLNRGGWASPEETKALRAMSWQSIEVELHSGEEQSKTVHYSATPAPPAYDSSLPLSRRHISLTFNMNAINHLSEDKHGRVRLTVNPSWAADAQRWRYELPFPTAASSTGLRGLEEVQNTRRISYLGAWSASTGYARHEDAVAASLALLTAAPFGASRPFPQVDAYTPSGGEGASDRALKNLIGSAESSRRMLAPYWPYIAWPVIIALVVAETATTPLVPLGVGALHSGLARLRLYWAGQA